MSDRTVGNASLDVLDEIHNALVTIASLAGEGLNPRDHGERIHTIMKLARETRRSLDRSRREHAGEATIGFSDGYNCGYNDHSQHRPYEPEKSLARHPSSQRSEASKSSHDFQRVAVLSTCINPCCPDPGVHAHAPRTAEAPSREPIRKGECVLLANHVNDYGGSVVVVEHVNVHCVARDGTRFVVDGESVAVTPRRQRSHPETISAPDAGRSRKAEHPIHDWIPFSKRARYETIIETAREALEAWMRAGDHGKASDVNLERRMSDLDEALNALDADWPKDKPSTSVTKERP